MGARRQRRRLPNTALGAIMIVGGALAAVSAALPPPAVHSEAAVVAIGGLALAVGAALVFTRRRLHPVVIGTVVALGTVLITVTTWAGGPGNGTADNEMLYIWVCLYSFYFLGLTHALAQLALVGVAYGWLLSDDGAHDGLLASEAVNQWLITMVTLLVAGLLVARLRDSLRGLLAELGERARRDSLTGLLNRHELEERGAAELARRRRHGSDLSLIALDLDGFKGLNDALGHPAGDRLLRAVSEVLDTETREIDSVARVGGDEFVVLLPGAGTIEAGHVAARLLDAIRGSGVTGAEAPTVSIGVATAANGTNDLELLWAAADQALYVAKRAGGDRVAVAGTEPAAAG